MDKVRAGYDLKAVEFNPFTGPQILLIAPATPAQIEIWLACTLGGNEASCSYNESFTLKLFGQLDIVALTKALNNLVTRHDSLRSVFSPDGNKNFVYDHLEPAYSFEDLTLLSDDIKKQTLDDFFYHNSQTAFDLVFGPLFRIKLFKINNEEHQLVLTLHHIVCDGWSFGIILQELGKLYSAFAQGLEPVLEPAPQFSSYALEQLDFLGSDEYKVIERYWLDQYKTAPPVINLPTDKSRPSLRTYASGTYGSHINVELTSALKKLAFNTGASTVTTLLAIFEVLLQRVSGSDDIVVGVPVAGQPAIGKPGLVGHCVNLLALRSFAPEDSSFLDYLKTRRTAIMDAYDHQLITFGSLLKKISLPRDASRVPLVPVILNSDMGMDEGIVFYGLRHELKTNPRRYENFELFVNINDIGEGLNIEWSYNAQLYSLANIEQLASAFEDLLKNFTENPALSIKKGQLKKSTGNGSIADWNNTDAFYAEESPLHQLISNTAVRFPDKPAVIGQQSILSYKKLDERADQLAARLAANGVIPGDIVGLAVDRTAELLIALLAISKTGAAYLPIDPDYPAGRINYMLNDSSAKLLVVSQKYAGHFHSGAVEMVFEKALEDSARLPVTPPATIVKGSDLAYILYTSGSTGKPKGVQIAHCNLVNFLTSMQNNPGITPADKLLAVTTISFDIAGLELFLPLLSGATVVIADAATAKDGRSLLQLVERENITMMQATPYTWKMMLESGWDQKLPLKVLCGGEALPKDLALRLLPKCAQLWNLYGPTETTIWSAVKEITSDDQLITVGKPIANTRIYILNEKLESLLPGEAGEIFIAGDGVSAGYLNRPELTKEKFIPDIFSAAAEKKMYRTGDVGKFCENGDIQYLGRADQQVKIRGYRIETDEIAFTLSRLADIKNAVVDARKDTSGNLALAAYIIPAGEIKDSRMEIQNWRMALRDTLPEYMVPQYYTLLKEFPLTPNGKIDRKALPEPDHNLSRMTYSPPRTSIEKQVADIWSRYMGIEKIGIYDDFFDLGGHSLVAVDIMTALQKETGKHLPLASLFEHSTIEKLALLLHMDGKSITWDSLVPIKPLGNKMPLYIVHGAGLHVLLFNTLAMNMDPDQPVFGLQAKGLNGIDEPISRMEAIAANYIAEIIAQNPDGPYALAGYSFGGIIAFEMARQLEAMGKQVKMLAMFDTYAYRSDHFDPWYKKSYNRLRFFSSQVIHSFVLLAKYPKRTIQYKSEMLRRKVIEAYWKLARKDQNQEGFFGYSYKIDLANEQAERNYQLTPYPVRIELFRAQKLTFYMDDFEFLGWKPYALNGVSIHEIPGEHNYIFAPPNDKEFARILQECLDKASAQDGL